MASVMEKLYGLGLYKKVSAEVAECIVCSANSNEPKYLKTAKYSCTTLLRHLKQHEEYQKKFASLKDSQPPVTRYLVTSAGTHV